MQITTAFLFWFKASGVDAGGESGGDDSIDGIAAAFVNEDAIAAAVAEDLHGSGLNGGIRAGDAGRADVGSAGCRGETRKRRKDEESVRKKLETAHFQNKGRVGSATELCMQGNSLYRRRRVVASQVLT